MMRVLLLMMLPVVCIGIDQQNTNLELDPQYSDVLCSLDGVEFQTATRSVLECLALCTGVYTPGCISLIYVEPNNMCYGLKEYIPGPFCTALPGARFYKVAAPACISTGPLVPEVADSKLTASSFYDATGPYPPQNGRLGHSSYWSAKDITLNEYIQVEFISTKVIVKVITQGAGGYSEWTTSYRVLTSLDCVTFVPALDENGNEIFSGNNDESTQVSQTLFTPTAARCVRINPQTYNTWLSMRLELTGCDM